jgi:endonuclease III
MLFRFRLLGPGVFTIMAGQLRESARPRRPPSGKKPFDIEEAIGILRKAVAPYPKAALFELAAEGHDSVFDVLVACILSIRTRDETSIQVARALFAKADTPAKIARLSEKEIDQLIGACTFHEGKARTIRAIARQAVEEYDGTLPCDEAVLRSFHGVGPKCANLALGIACNAPLIGVDIHVHRVTNRWGLVKTRTPEKTMEALQELLPVKYRVEINALLVPFGKHICTGSQPLCSTCPLRPMCQQVGVNSHR